jgi:ectoine hydroxylase-related dioxygenase (phytanoyl-CoA dioxygenase family)
MRHHLPKATLQKVSDDVINNLPKNSLITPHMEPGDVLLHHSCMIHGSMDNLSDYDRRGMSMWYKAKSAGIDKGNLRNYENSLKEQLENLNTEK